MKNETKLTLEPSGATLGGRDFLSLNEFNTITVAPTDKFRIRELCHKKK